jgi:hypothetical protein
VTKSDARILLRGLLQKNVIDKDAPFIRDDCKGKLALPMVLGQF